MSTTCTFMRRYKILDQIGEGSFSEVLKCLDIQTEQYVAAKKLKKRYDTWKEASNLAELVTMQTIPAHANLLSMLGVHYDIFMGTVTFIFDLMDMSLYDYMDSRKRCIPEARAKCYLYQMLRGLHHLHEFGVFHRDIKPENILMKIPIDPERNKNYELIKIGDLGSVKGIKDMPPYTEYISTRWYRSPECLLTKGYYESKMDIWATGCVFYEMLTTKPLFAGVNEIDQLSKIHQVLGTPTPKVLGKFRQHKSCNWDKIPKQIGSGLAPLLSNISADGANLMKLMIIYDPEVRATVKQLLSHKYFAHLRALSSRKELPKQPISVEQTPCRIVPKPMKAATTINIQKSQPRRTIVRRTNCGNIFNSLTENNIVYSNQYEQPCAPKPLYKNISPGVAKNATLRSKITKHSYYNFNIMKGIESQKTQLINNQIRKEKEIKNKITEQTKQESEKYYKSIPSMSECSSIKKARTSQEYQKEIKKSIDTTRQNFENYHDIMKRIEYKRNLVTKPGQENVTKEIKKHLLPMEKYDELRKRQHLHTFDDLCKLETKKRMHNYQMLVKEEKKLIESKNNYRKANSDLTDYYRKLARDSKVSPQSKSFVMSHTNYHKRLDPIKEVIEPKRAKLFQGDTSMRNFTKYLESRRVKKVV